MNTTHPGDPSSQPLDRSALLDLIRDWRLFRNFAILGVVLSIVTILVVGKRYTTSVSFVPQGTRTGQLRGLAAQFGFDVAGNEGGESPFFYVELVRTKEVLTRVVNGHFSDGTTRGDYASFHDITEADSALRTFKAIRTLEKRLAVTADRRTGLVSFSVTEDDPRVSLQLADLVLSEIARYNRETRQSRAAAERRFVEARLIQARKEVTISEDSLERFLVKNRSYQSSPELKFEFDRLQRSVTHRAGVVSSLAQNYEQTRIDEVRDTPVFSLVQPPRLPPRHDSRGWVRAVVLGAIGGLVVAFALRLLMQFVGDLIGRPVKSLGQFVAGLRQLLPSLTRPR